MSQKPRRHKKNRFRFRKPAPRGTSPGTIIVDPLAATPIITVLAYDGLRIEEQNLDRVQQIRDYLGHWPVVWVNVDGLGDAGILERCGELFGLHRLALEDVVNIHQRAKVEPYADHLFIVTRMPRQGEHPIEKGGQAPRNTPVPNRSPQSLGASPPFSTNGDRFDTEQVSLFLGANYVLTFLEDPGDCFDGVRQRLRESRGRIRSVGPDYLAYALLDSVIDSYFPLLEEYGERLDDLEAEAILRGTRQTIARIHAAKTDLLQLRRAVWPHREAFNRLVRDENPLVRPETRIYFRDCYDHTVQMIDLIEVYRELGSDLRDLYLTSVSNRMNEVMKVLTVITTIFMPLTLIVGIYGMNFNTEVSPWNMPELKWRYGYPFVLGLMTVVTLFMLWLFRRKGWLGQLNPPREDDPLEERTEK